MIKSKKLLALFISLGSIVLAVVLGLMVFLWFRSTPRYAVEQVIRSVKTDNYRKFQRVMPKFSNGKSISEADFDAFVNASDGKNVENAKMKKTLANTNNFTMHRQGLLSAVKIVPTARYIAISTSDSDSIIGFNSNKRNLILSATSGDNVGPLIPANYKLTYDVKSTKFGEASKKGTFDLTKDNGSLSVDESDFFLSNMTFQKTMLNVLLNYYKSFANCVDNGLDFSGLQEASAGEKQAAIEFFSSEKSNLSAYSESFSTFVMNVDSIKIDPSDDNTFEFDVYTDDSVTITPNGQPAETDNSHNATVTLVFDSDSGNWQVDNVDFETYSQNPKNWEHIQKVSTKQPVVANWNSDQIDKNNAA